MIETSAPAKLSRIVAPDCSVDLHGVTLDFSGPPGVIAAIKQRTGNLPPAQKAASYSLTFKYALADDADAHACLRPSGEGRPFYQPHSGEATYWLDDDLCYLELGSQARALCHAREGCLVSLVRPEQQKLWLASHPLTTLPLVEMLKRLDLFFVHAAAFAVDGRSLLLPGSSGAGKSTLSLALLCAGVAYMGDDLAFLDGKSASRILSFPEPISATGRSLQFFEESSDWLRSEPFTALAKYDIALESISTTPICQTAIPAVIVFPEIGHTATSVFTPISADEAFSRLAANVLLTERHSTQAHLAALAALARSTRTYKLRTGTNLSDTANRLRELLR